ncbi:CENPB protein Homeodomainlike [Phytophthora megakarya]|uniref:CENPB protein Homeodomainlike n=1 Tax=Phytophthora megakarya TaxID=4795 RepID=A0A225UXL7_9STRA|nr:CENPB protein Homeodomainlike [Phytophthora megakarya]
MLQIKALEAADDEGLPRGIFKAYHSWRWRFMKRHKLSIRARTRQGQTTPEDAAAAKAKFSVEVREMIIEHGITNVFNADQTAVFFEYLPSKTVSAKGARTIWVNAPAKIKSARRGVSRREHVQQENNSFRHGFDVRIWKEIYELQALHGRRIYGNPTAWWNSNISVAFLKYHFGSRDNLAEKILLLWDDFNGHWTDEVKD